ncbi:23S rRNA (guanosine(2251)-2'-O)-methyltransferase RlmB [Rothia sp. AR01]|uniref:23S rRNA (Guanosine(2251)-2'-O)-methyltransferase RlmB n=1 Tax=Rothia santali TaxID=2949643 RepID=A0A9X2KII8_9MICC|nr:23S rRNA (guanosine(2251)-2'-O)-methyltransferase RlmB [Rothia santali]MCP3426293.1 23S rRNA (guanosine(2251)-2'-O)-methyltransferase RlmB [Rothia santali]
MADNSRPGAIRKKKKAPLKGTGGKGRRALEGKGPTPRAEDRPYHKAHKMKKAAERRQNSAGPARQPRLGGKRASEELVTGRNAVLEALRTGIPSKHLFVMSNLEADDRVKEILAITAREDIPALEITRSELERLTEGAVHQGVALQIPQYKYPDASDLGLSIMERWHAGELSRPPLFVALDGITDPRNLGAIIRCVSAFSGQAVIVPERRSAGVTASAWKTSAGAVSRIPVAKATNLTRVIQQLKDQGVFVVGLDGDGDVALPDLSLATEPLCVVAGSEGKGLSRLVAENCDQIVSIPIDSAMESLNASMAVGIALYEVGRLRKGE